jgi:spoIIIJ-associated protein
MEWVETTAKSVEEAKDLLLDQLGVDEQEAEFEIIEEPKPGLFGRTRGQARLRARVAPKAVRAKEERRRKPKKDRPADAAPAAKKAEAPAPAQSKPREPKASTAAAPTRERSPKPAENTAERLDAEIARAEAQSFLEQLVAKFGLVAEVTVTVNEDSDLVAEINGTGLGRLIGPQGAMVNAVEELTRTRLQHVADGAPTPRLRLDIGNSRALRRTHLTALVDDTVVKVRDTGSPHVIDVVQAWERKLIHDRVAETATDLETKSEGQDPTRRVAIQTA